MERICNEVLEHILYFVPPLDLKRNQEHLPQVMQDLIESHRFWRLHPLAPVHGNDNLSLAQLQRCCAFASEPSSRALSSLTNQSLLVSGADAVQLKEEGKHVCLASTTDNVTERLENVLFTEQDSMRHPIFGTRGVDWWSSRPSESQDSNEMLLFSTTHPLVLMSEVCVKHLRDPYMARNLNVIYTPHKVQISVYRLSHASTSGSQALSGIPCTFERQDSGEEGPALRTLYGRLGLFRLHSAPSGQKSIDALLKGQTPVYTSQEFSVPPHDDGMINFSLPNVIGNVVVLTLIGKNFEQTQGLGYYVCMERVECKGIPLEDVEIQF